MKQKITIIRDRLYNREYCEVSEDSSPLGTEENNEDLNVEPALGLLAEIFENIHSKDPNTLGAESAPGKDSL